MPYCEYDYDGTSRASRFVLSQFNIQKYGVLRSLRSFLAHRTDIPALTVIERDNGIRALFENVDAIRVCMRRSAKLPESCNEQIFSQMLSNNTLHYSNGIMFFHRLEHIARQADAEMKCLEQEAKKRKKVKLT